MKVSVSIPDEDVVYLQTLVDAGRFSSRSAALHAAVRGLRDRDRGADYAAAWDEWAASDDAALWESTVGDGLE
jgi:Arc/MetJ-type ribon-helix-helix transcriptional regulator